MVRSVRHEEQWCDGEPIGDYLVRATLGTGGCATVYLVEHGQTRERFALKLMHRGFVASPKLQARFAREIELLRRVAHPGVVRVVAVGQLPDLRPYYVMERLEGITLGALLKERGRLSPAELYELFEPLCLTLDAVHRAGVVHRDINSANVFVCDDGERQTVKILDFGIARLLCPEPGAASLTTAGRRLGTPSTMAPEQILGCAVDARVDVYALGVLLFRALTGRCPFRGDDLNDVEMAHVHAQPPRPSELAPGHRALDAVVLRCLEKRPRDRYEGTRALLDDLRAAVFSVAAARGGAGAGEADDARAIGVHVETRLPIDAPFHDAVLDDAEALLDAAEEALGAERFEVILQTGNALFGVRLLPADADEAALERRRTAALVGRLRRALAALVDRAPHPRVEWRVCAHEDAAVSRGARVVGGPILRLSRWLPDEPRDATTTLSGNEAREVSRCAFP